MQATSLTVDSAQIDEVKSRSSKKKGALEIVDIVLRTSRLIYWYIL